MDKLDTKIMVILQEDGTRTNAAIARETGVSEETVRRRLKRMLEDKVFELVAIPDPNKMGFECQVMIGIEASPGDLDYVAEALADLPDIGRVTITTGAFSIIAWLNLKSASELHDYLSLNVGRIDGVNSMQTFLILRTVKESHKLAVGA